MSVRLYGTTLSWDDGSGNIVWLEFDVTTEETNTGITQVQTHQTEIGAISDGCIDDPDTTTVTGIVSRCPIPSSDMLGTGRKAGDFVDKRLDVKYVYELAEKVRKLDIPSPKVVGNLASVAGAVMDALVGSPPELSTFEPKKENRSAQMRFWSYGEDQPRPFEVFAVLTALRLARTPIRVVSPIIDMSDMLITSIEAKRTVELGRSAGFTVTLQKVKTAVAAQGEAPAEPAAQPRKAVVAAAKENHEPAFDDPDTVSLLKQGSNGMASFLDDWFN